MALVSSECVIGEVPLGITARFITVKESFPSLRSVKGVARVSSECIVGAARLAPVVPLVITVHLVEVRDAVSLGVAI